MDMTGDADCVVSTSPSPSLNPENTLYPQDKYPAPINQAFRNWDPGL